MSVTCTDVTGGDYRVLLSTSHDNMNDVSGIEYCSIGGAKIAYLLQGGDDRRKPLFITLHGGRGFGESALLM